LSIGKLLSVLFKHSDFGVIFAPLILRKKPLVFEADFLFQTK